MFVCISLTLLAIKKQDIPGAECSPLDKTKPNGPCECTDDKGSKWRCDNCSSGADCDNGPIYNPPRSNSNPNTGGIVIIGFPGGIRVYDSKLKGLSMPISEWDSTTSNKKFKLDFGRGKDNKPIPVWTEVQEDSPQVVPANSKFSDFALIISSIILSLAIFFGLKSIKK